MSGIYCTVLHMKGKYSCDQHVWYQKDDHPVCEHVLGGTMPYAFKRIQVWHTSVCGTQVCNDFTPLLSAYHSSCTPCDHGARPVCLWYL